MSVAATDTYVISGHHIATGRDRRVPGDVRRIDAADLASKAVCRYLIVPGRSAGPAGRDQTGALAQPPSRRLRGNLFVDTPRDY